jgi:hypothetical protein
MQKIVIIRDTYHAGKPVKVGDIVEADETHAGLLLGASAARLATAEDLTTPAHAPAAPVIETAQASPGSETATTRPARRRA